ncbi:MAG: hypothetical protein JSV80_15265, partial [Acidobacteriota bacterium]
GASRRAARARAHVLMARLSDGDESERHWREAWRIHPTYTAQQAFGERRDLERVVTTFADEVREKPWSWLLQAQYGAALLEADRASEAIGPLREAARLAPAEMKRVHEQLARALAVSGQREQALEVLRQTYPQQPDAALGQLIERLISPASFGPDRS